MKTARMYFGDGIKAIAPILLGVVPFALIAGVAAVENGLQPIEGSGMSVIVFAGASQLAALQLIGQGAIGVAILTAIIINLRFVLYSLSLAPYLKHLSTPLKMLHAYWLTDQAYAVAIVAFEKGAGQRDQHWFLMGASMVMWVVWQIGTLLGVLLGAGVPPSWQLDFAIPLTFIALAVPTLKDRPAWAAAAVTGLAAVAGMGLPYNLGLPLAVVLGIAAGMGLEGRAALAQEAA